MEAPDVDASQKPGGDSLPASPGEGTYVFNPTPTAETSTGEVLDGGSLNKRFRVYAKLAKLPDEATFHTHRHTCARWLAMDGASLHVVKELPGYASSETTEPYAHLAPDVFRAVVQKTLGGQTPTSGPA